MSKERELLKRWIGGGLLYNSVYISLMEETQELLSQPEQEPDIGYFVKEIHKKCFHQSYNTPPVITVRNALSIFRKCLKKKRTPVEKPKFDQEEFDEMVRKGTKAWSGVDVNKFFDEWNSLPKSAEQSENLGKMYDES